MFSEQCNSTVLKILKKFKAIVIGDKYKNHLTLFLKSFVGVAITIANNPNRDLYPEHSGAIVKLAPHA
jgi:hypothetical protein